MISERKVDMSSFIGHYDAKSTIDLGKGIILKTKWNILPACPKLHNALISKYTKGEEVKNEVVDKDP